MYFLGGTFSKLVVELLNSMHNIDRPQMISPSVFSVDSDPYHTITIEIIPLFQNTIEYKCSAMTRLKLTIRRNHQGNQDRLQPSPQVYANLDGILILRQLTFL